MLWRRADRRSVGALNDWFPIGTSESTVRIPPKAVCLPEFVNSAGSSSGQFAVMPPSITNSLPVIQAASSDAR
jgi:hypothetical protein